MATTKKQVYQFLSFKLTSELEAMFLTEELGEILTIDLSQVVPIFDLYSAMMGVYNHRGEILWVVDLPCLLGLPPLYKQNYRNSCSVTIVEKSNKVLGLAVPQVGQLVLSHQGQIQPSQTQTNLPKLAFCLKGEKRSLKGKTLLALDRDKIFELVDREQR